MWHYSGKIEEKLFLEKCAENLSLNKIIWSSKCRIYGLGTVNTTDTVKFNDACASSCIGNGQPCNSMKRIQTSIEMMSDESCLV